MRSWTFSAASNSIFTKPSTTSHRSLRPIKRTRDSREEEKSTHVKSWPRERSWQGRVQFSSTRQFPRTLFFFNGHDWIGLPSEHNDETLNDVFYRRLTKLQK